MSWSEHLSKPWSKPWSLSLSLSWSEPLSEPWSLTSQSDDDDDDEEDIKDGIVACSATGNRTPSMSACVAMYRKTSAVRAMTEA